MEANRFDQISKRFARRLSRRRALQQLGASGLAAGLLAAAALPAGATATQGTPAATAVADALAANNATSFVQTATGGSFRPNPLAGTAASSGPGTPAAAQHGTYLLTLHGHNGETIAFADRPQRTFAEVPTRRFFTGMGFTAVNPPNAALVADLPGQPDAVVLLELLNPEYDAGTQTLTYEANLLHQYPNARGNALAPLVAKAHAPALPAALTFGPASLFIDDCPDGNEGCWAPGGDQCVFVGYTTFGNCWSWSTWTCNPCGAYPSHCNSAYSICNNSCLDDIALCGAAGCCSTCAGCCSISASGWSCRPNCGGC